MADKGRKGDEVFFIYDHNMLKREEDDLKDAILFFTPDTYSIEDQCALCGQLMGISEFLKATLGKSAPRIFKFKHEKFALKRTGAYTFGLKGGSFIPDSLLNTQLTSLCEIFITYHGSIDSLKLRCKEIAGGFLQELDNIWKIILDVSKVFHGYTLSQTFQTLPYLQLPESGTHLFLQASHLLQSSQRRPCVLAGTILYKNRVLCTQLPPQLTSHLTYLQNQIPHIVKKTDCDLPVGCRIVTLFLTDEELSEISSLDSLARHHCKITDFSVCRESDGNVKKANKTSKQLKSVTKRRLTCPNLSVPNSQKTLHSYITTGQKGACLAKPESVAVDNFSWSYKSKLSLSHVPIVECKHGESPSETDAEILYEKAEQSQFGESYKQVAATANCDNEQSETDSETDNVIDPSNEEEDCDKHSVDSPTVKCAEEKVVENISSHSDHDPDVVLKFSSNGTVDEERTEEKGLCEPKTEICVEMEGKKSDHSYNSSEHKDLCDSSDKKGRAVVTDVSDTEQNLKRQLENKIGQAELTDVKHENKDPSISDLEDEDTEKEQNSTKQINESCRSTKNVLEHGIENKVTSVETTVGINDESYVAEIALSNSSSEGVKSRFYDCISDTETKTLTKDSDHSVHQHIVDVHIEDSGVGLESEKKTVNNGGESYETESSCKTGGDQTLFESEKNADGASACLDNVPPGSSLDKFKTAVSREDVNETVANTKGKQFHGNENSGTYNKSEDSKENIDPNVSLHQDILSGTNKYESEIETEDEGISIAMIAPCINCLELASQQPTHGETLRCGHCIEQFNKRRMFPRFTNDQEIIDFNQKGRERYESGAETDGVADVEKEGSGPSKSLMSSLSSDVSTDSTISRYWTQEMDGLNDVTLYVQCHSDISLLLLMENPEHYEESLFHSLWKGSLAQLADLDFYIKECIDSAEDDNNNSGNKYLKYDIFAAALKGTIEDPGTDRKSSNLHQMLARLHTEFQQEECLSDAILRSHFNSCYGHSNQVEETYFQADLPQKSSGFPAHKDPVFSLDMLARQHLANEKHLSLL